MGSDQKKKPKKQEPSWNGDPITGPPKPSVAKEDGTFDPFLAMPQARPD